MLSDLNSWFFFLNPWYYLWPFENYSQGVYSLHLNYNFLHEICSSFSTASLLKMNERRQIWLRCIISLYFFIKKVAKSQKVSSSYFHNNEVNYFYFNVNTNVDVTLIFFILRWFENSFWEPSLIHLISFKYHPNLVILLRGKIKQIDV